LGAASAARAIRATGRTGMTKAVPTKTLPIEHSTLRRDEAWATLRVRDSPK